MMNDSIKFEPYRAYGLLGDYFCKYFPHFFFILVSMARNENGQRVSNHMYDTRQLKERFCKSFVKIPEKAWE